MKTRSVTLLVSIAIASFGSIMRPDAAESPSGSAFQIPPHYKLGSGGCRPGGGYSFVADASDYASTYPKLILRVFNGELIGIVLEVGAEAGWKPWYDQPDGKPVSHGGGPAHYSQAIYMKKPPTAEECAASKGPWDSSKLK